MKKLFLYRGGRFEEVVKGRFICKGGRHIEVVIPQTLSGVMKRWSL